MSIENPLIKGQVVKALKGRDQGKVQVVFEILDSSYVTVVDGKRRTVANPKKKKVKHLQPYRDIIQLTDQTDKAIREMLKLFQ